MKTRKSVRNQNRLNNILTAQIEQSAIKERTKEFLFTCTHVTCFSYCDTTREKHGDYLEIGRLYFSPLRIEILEKNKKYSEVYNIMKKDFYKLSKQETVEVSSTGQTTKITLV